MQSIRRNPQSDSDANEADHDSEFSESEATATQTGHSLSRREKLEAWQREKKAKGTKSSKRDRLLTPVTSSDLNAHPTRKAGQVPSSKATKQQTLKLHSLPLDDQARTCMSKAGDKKAGGKAEEREGQPRQNRTGQSSGRVTWKPLEKQGQAKRQPFQIYQQHFGPVSGDREEESTSSVSEECHIEDGSSTVRKEVGLSLAPNESSGAQSSNIVTGALQSSAQPRHELPSQDPDPVLPEMLDLHTPTEDLVDVSEESEAEDDFSPAELKFQLFDTTNRLTRCTALLQKMVDENKELQGKVSQTDALKERAAELESSLRHQQLLYTVAIESVPPKRTLADAASQTVEEEGEVLWGEALDGLGEEERVVAAGGSGGNVFVTAEGGPSSADRSQSPKREAEAEGEGDEEIARKRSRLSSGSDDSAGGGGGGGRGGVEASRGGEGLLAARCAALEEEVVGLRRSAMGAQAVFTAERQRLVGKLLESEEGRREAVETMKASARMWQELMDNQMRALKDRLAAATGQGHVTVAAPDPPDDGQPELQVQVGTPVEGGEPGGAPELLGGGSRDGKNFAGVAPTGAATVADNGEGREGPGASGDQVTRTAGQVTREDPLVMHPLQSDFATVATSGRGHLKSVSGPPEPIQEDPEVSDDSE